MSGLLASELQTVVNHHEGAVIEHGSSGRASSALSH